MSEPTKYRKKPVTIWAIPFTGGAESATEVIDWALPQGGTIRYHEYCPAEEWELEDGSILGHPEEPEQLAIETLEGTMRADIGAFIIRGVSGEFYPCKPDIFAKTYEEVAE